MTPSGTARRVVYQDACHLRHAQGVRDQPRELLRAVPGLELVEIEGADICCGSAGIYNLTQPRGRARARRAQGARDPRRPSPTSSPRPTRAARFSWRRRFATSGAGDLPVVHPVELLPTS